MRERERERERRPEGGGKGHDMGAGGGLPCALHSRARNDLIIWPRVRQTATGRRESEGKPPAAAMATQTSEIIEFFALLYIAN